MVRYKSGAAFVFSGFLIATASCSDIDAEVPPQAASSVVASVDGTLITREDLDRDGSIELRRLYRQVEEVERRALGRLVDDALLRGEAQRRHLSIEQLLDSRPDGPGAATGDPVIDRHQRRRQLLDALRRERPVELFLAPIKEKVDLAVGVSVGPVGAPVSVVEFSDLSCGYSAAMFAKLERLRADPDVGSRIRWTSVDLYSKASGPEGRLAARASRCSAAQGRAMELRKALFEGGMFATASQDRSILQALAERVGLDAGEFMRCVDSDSWEAELERSAREARRVGVSETPTVFVNGRRLPQSATLDAMRAMVQDELRKLKR